MRNNKGFTLIELLVVIAIIGLLSTLAVISLNNARQKSRDAKRVADVKQIQTALEPYFNDRSGYPTAGLTDPNMATYMANVPSNPTPVDGAGCAGNGAYDYTSVDGTSYSVTYCLGATTGEIQGDTPQTATPSGIK